MSDNIIQLNEDLIKHDLKDLVRMKNEIVNSTLSIPSGILSRTIHIYSFIHSCYLYLNPDSSGRSFYE